MRINTNKGPGGFGNKKIVSDFSKKKKFVFDDSEKK